jgi:hypothetical protein
MSEYEDDFEASGTGGANGKGSNLSPMIRKGLNNNNNMLMPINEGSNQNKV